MITRKEVEEAIRNLISILIIILGVAMIILAIEDFEDKRERKVQSCESIEGCDKYECYAEKLSISVWSENNYLLKQQNCILEKQGKNESMQ